MQVGYLSGSQVAMGCAAWKPYSPTGLDCLSDRVQAITQKGVGFQGQQENRMSPSAADSWDFPKKWLNNCGRFANSML